MKALVISLLLGVATPALADEGKCPRINPKMLDELTANRGGNVTLVFFASWCAACKEHLTETPRGPTLLIGVFDKRERLEEVVQTLGVKTECYTDDGVADELGVSALPAKRSYGVTLNKAGE